MSIYIDSNLQFMEEWDYDKNEGISPSIIALHSNKSFFWKCPVGHPSYYASPSHRMRGNGCPVCSNHQIIAGINDLQTLSPELIEEWLWDENNALGIYPNMVSCGSSKKVWWKCRKCENSWQSSISNRTRLHSCCPYCANLKVKTGFNDLRTINPEAAEDWDYEKNGELTPETIVAYSAKPIWWKCKTCGGTWRTTPNERKKRKCPYCNKHSVLKGYNDLETKMPELCRIWDYEKNVILPSQVFCGSEKKVWWRCELGHSWKAQINSITKGGGCPYCSNKRILVGFNDLFTSNPELKQEWDFEKNTSITPEEVAAGSNKKAWWKCCKCGHKWYANIASRASGRGCPLCGKEKNQISRLKTMASKNPLFEQFPELETEWDFDKNCDLDITLIPASSNRKVWWRCANGHSFDMQINLRTRQNERVGCPYCHNQRVLTGINDLATLNPELTKEWDYEKNAPLFPSDVFSHGAQKVWWKCQVCNTSWRAKINNRAHGRGCPNCNPNGTSFYEQAIYFYIKQVFPEATNRDKSHGFEFDIYIASLRTAIEIDSAFFHSGEVELAREGKKNNFCKSNDIRLIRVRENPLGPSDGAENLLCDCSTWNKLGQTCKSVLALLDKSNLIDVSIERDYYSIVDLSRMRLKEKAFFRDTPQLLKEWDNEKNGKLLPDYFTKGSNAKVWWKCEKGHSWKAQISNRSNGVGCPFCSGKKAIEGENDLLTHYPQVAEEWHPIKNGDLKPKMVTKRSQKEIWWQCKRGHEWKTTVANRVTGRGCPYCSNRYVLVGYNDLSTTNPQLAKEWHPTKNGDLLPSMVVAGTAKKVWWQCENGHEWQATITSRNKGRRCRICSRSRKSNNSKKG